MEEIAKKFEFLENEQFSFIREIDKKFPKSEVYLIGGAVRDILLGKTPSEHDFVVRNVQLSEIEAFSSTLGYTDLVGKNFGVLKFRPKDQEHIYDIALPRTDHALATGGYKDVDAQYDHELPLEKDLKRRDFTINAIAYHVQKNKLIDHFNGQRDLEKKIIKTVGSPEERFKEDYSRALRALRFATQLNFEIEKNTWEELQKTISNINQTRKNGCRIVPLETISKEFLKSLYADPIKTMDLWDSSGAIKEIIPELLTMKECDQPTEWHTEGDVWEHTRLCFEKMESIKYKKEFPEDSRDITLLVAVLFHDIGKPYTLATPEKDNIDRIRFNEHDTRGAEIFSDIAKRLRLSSVPNLYCDIEKVAWLIRHHMLLVCGPIKNLKNTTIEKYFFNKEVPGDLLLKLFWIDGSATIPKDKHNTLIRYQQMQKRINDLDTFKKNKLPPPLINGNDIMKLLNKKPSPVIGKIIDEIREEQLNEKIKSKEDAVQFIREKYA